jgi:hypothetical protein
MPSSEVAYTKVDIAVWFLCDGMSKNIIPE